MDLHGLLEALCTVSGHHHAKGLCEGSGGFITPFHVLISYCSILGMDNDSLRVENALGAHTGLDRTIPIVTDPEHDLAILRLDQPIGRRFLKPSPTSHSLAAFAPLLMLTRFKGQEIMQVEWTGETLVAQGHEYPLELDQFLVEGGLTPSHCGSPIIDRAKGQVVSLLSGAMGPMTGTMQPFVGAPRDAVSAIIHKAHHPA